MTTAYSPLLGLALPVTGELAGTWGDTVNDYITSYLDSAVAGTQTISGSQTAVTLSKTTNAALSQAGTGSTGSAQYSVINCTGNPAGLLTITVPAASKTYVVVNATSTNQQVKVVGTGPTTGVTLDAGERAIIAWNGSDFIKVASSTVDGVSTISFGSTGLTPSTATSGAVTVAGTLATGSGGTGLTTFGAANRAIYSTSSSALTAGTLPTAAGGTGLTSFTANGVVYASSSSALTTGSALTFDGTKALLMGDGSSATFTVPYSTNGNTFKIRHGTGEDTALVFTSSASAANNSASLNAWNGSAYNSVALSGANTAIFTLSGSEQMRLTSTGLGIGTSSPGAKLHVYGNYGYFQDGTYNGYFGKGNGVVVGGGTADLGISTSTGSIVFGTGGSLTERMRLDSSGNLGLGVTPQTWWASRKALQINSGGAFVGSNAGFVEMYGNAYLDGSAQNRYLANGTAALYQTGNGHIWFTAPSGTAGNAISFTQAMTLSASAELSVGGTGLVFPTSGRGNITINGTGSTLLGFKVNGSDSGYINHTGTTLDIVNGANAAMTFATNGTERARITSDGAFGIANGTQTVNTVSSKLVLGNKGYFSDSTIGGAWITAVSGSPNWYSGTSLAFYTNAGPDVTGVGPTERLRITSTGDVGIGTSSPSAKLDVYGSDPRIQSFNSSGPKNILLAGGTIGYTGMTTNHPLAFITNDTERMRLDTSGNLGLGVTPSAWGTSKAIQISRMAINVDSSGRYNNISTNAYNDGSWKYIASSVPVTMLGMDNVNGSFAFLTAPSGTAGNAISFTQAMTLDASGNLGVGTTSPESILHVAKASSGGLGAQLILDNTAASALNNAVEISFLTDGGASGSGIRNARIRAVNENAVNGNANLQFWTWNGGIDTERARITSAGYFKASDNAGYGTGAHHEFTQSAANSQSVVIDATSGSYTSEVLFLGGNRNTTNGTWQFLRCFNRASTTDRLFIADSGNVTNTNGSYGTISDAKMKTDIVDAGSQWADIKAIRFRKFKMKDDPSGLLQLGVVAQELEQTSPGLVDEHTDRDAEGNDLGTTTKSVKTSVLLMKAAVALQEAMARIEQLEAKVAALEAK